MLSDTPDLRLGDCREVMAGLPDASVDAIATDPPYGLSFMGKGWDHGVPGVEFWVEALRVLKPGGHLLAFGGTRTFHRLACAIEDAGFEVRDCLSWIYGSGFPKSLDVAKAIDRGFRRDEVGAEYEWRPTHGPTPDVYAVTAFVRAQRDLSGMSNREIDDAFGFNGMSGHWTSAGSQPAVPTWPQWETLKELLGMSDEMDELVVTLNGGKGDRSVEGTALAERNVLGTKVGKDAKTGDMYRPGAGEYVKNEYEVTEPATAAARAWAGWGTALKPAWEPIVLARRPLVGTVAANVHSHGTGALNVDGCRIGGRDGRWPANVMLDEWSEPGLRLRGDVDPQVARVIRLYFGQVRDVPATHAHVPESNRPKEVLRTGLLREGVRAENRKEIAALRNEAHDGSKGSNVSDEEGESSHWPKGFDVDGGATPLSRLRHSECSASLSRGAGGLLVDAESVERKIHPGAPTGDGSAAGASTHTLRDRPSPERDQVRQSACESRIVEQLNAQDGPRSDPARAEVPAPRERILEVCASEVPACWLTFFEETGRSVRRGSAAMLDEQSGELASGFMAAGTQREGLGYRCGLGSTVRNDTRGDRGGASRFLYVAKASSAERNSGGVRNVHPTVKPVSLMRWLCRLVTPPGGLVLDPFMGSGSTGVAALAEGFRFLGIEREAEYLEIARRRVLGPLFSAAEKVG